MLHYPVNRELRAADFSISAELRWYREFKPFVLIVTEGFFYTRIEKQERFYEHLSIYAG